jgi:Dolichyl-phosphate-mannose-protein mannosyltransferase
VNNRGFLRIACQLRLIGYDGVAAGLFLIGLALRLYRLDGRSLWLDEVTTAAMIRLQSIGDILLKIQGGAPDRAPLTFIITWVFRGLGGSEWAIRLPYAIASSLSVLSIYALGKTLGRPRAAVAAALLMAIMPFSLWYGQEARYYAFLMLFTSMQFLFAYRAVRESRLSDWLGLVVCSVLNLYTHYLAILVTGASFAFIGFTCAVELVAVARATVPRVRQIAIRIGYAVLAAGVTIAAYYLPWGPYLEAFLNRPDMGFGRVDAIHIATLDEFAALLASFNFTGIVLILAVLGAVAVIFAIRSNWTLTALFVAWLVVAVAPLWIKIGGGMLTLPPRYLSFLFPGAVMLAGIGVESVALAARGLVAHLGKGSPSLRRFTFAGVYCVTVFLLLSQTIPDIAHYYEVPKDDYRGVADHILATDPIGPVILTLGDCSSFVTESLSYYFWLRSSSAVIVDALQLDDRAVEALHRTPSSAWGALFDACNSRDSRTLSNVGLQIRQFVGLTLLRSEAPDATALEQAKTILRWASAFHPQLADSASLFDALAGNTALGANVLPLPDISRGETGQPTWSFWSGAEFKAYPGTFVLNSNGPMANATVNYSTTPRIKYVLSFQYLNADFRGTQAVFVSAHGVRGEWLDIFPTGAGYPCSKANQWSRGAFAFVVPETTNYLTIWLRATGSGTSEFQNVELRQVQ